MKKIAIASLLALTSSIAFADDVQLEVGADDAISVIEPKDVTNDAKNFTMLKSIDNKGFVKNDFNFTVSANVAMSVADTGRAFGVVTASPKGRNAFTGISEGGSIKECGEPVTAKNEPVLTDFDMTKDNACGYVATP